MSTIPASAIVNVLPNVLAAGGNALDLVGLMLTTDTRVPIGTVGNFTSANAMSEFFGPTSQMADLGAKYFNGFDNSSAKPGNMLVAQYPLTAVGAYLRGGDISAMTLAELQALSGALSVDIDGVTVSSSINLASATSFSNAASIIGDNLNIQGPEVAEFTGEIAGGTLTVTALASGTLGVGVVLSGTGITGGTYITALLTGVGGTGTYSISPSQNMSSSALTGNAPGVSYDSVSGAFVVVSETTGAASTITFGSGALATSLLLTEATGAVLSQGADAADPITFMDAIIAQNQNWATFALSFDPDGGSGHTEKLAFSEWTNDQNQRYAYVAWDTDTTPLTTNPATASMGAAISDAGYAGTFLIGGVDDDTGPQKAAFVLGIGASLDTEETNGRTDYCFRSQAGLVADVTDEQAADNLIANGYNFYGAYATANDEFVFLYPGSVSGDFLWMDSYINQIWMNNSFQLALMNYLTSARSTPFNAAGYTQVEAALNDPINAAVNFGSIRSGVVLSASQVSAINTAAGAPIASTVQNRGWYVKVFPASAAVRTARGPLSMKFWYTDGQSVQTINLDSIEVQ